MTKEKTKGIPFKDNTQMSEMNEEGKIRVGHLQGILMPNREFICNGKVMWLTEETIEKYFKDTEEENDKSR